MDCNDTLTFLKEWNRMCKNSGCNNCKVSDLIESLFRDDFSCKNAFKNLHKCLAIVQEWSDEHPIKTRMSEFLKMYPNAITIYDSLNICPMYVDKTFNCQQGCVECKKEYWHSEVEDNLLDDLDDCK